MEASPPSFAVLFNGRVHDSSAVLLVLTTSAVLWTAPASASEVPDSASAEAPRWSFRGEVGYYYLPDDTDYAGALVSADRGLIHLEARYHYEDYRTLSTFFGLNFGFGEEFRLELTPMAGVAVGNTKGLAPGLLLNLSYWKLELYSEAEYLFDFEDSGSNFFYTWTELSFWPVEWVRAGFVTERTRLIETGLEIERGFLVGFAYRQFAATVHVLNPGADGAYVMFSLSAEL